jgi:hypothetical protein
VIAPHVAKWDEEHHFPVDVIRGMGDLGLFGLTVPPEHGGTAGSDGAGDGEGSDFTSLCVAIEEIGRVDQSIGITLSAGAGLGVMPILRFGTDEHRAAWLPDLVAGRALAGFGLIMVTAVYLRIPETLPRAERHPGGVLETLKRMADLLGDWLFMRHVAIQCLSTAGFFVYIGGSSFVLETVYDISATMYAAVFATNATVMAISSLLVRMLVGRVDVARLRNGGVLAATAASLGLVGVALLERQALPPLVLPWVLLCCVTAGMGFVIPATTALAQEAGRRARGTASALQGGLSFFVGALVTPLTGVVGYRSMLPMALLMAGFFLAAISLVALSRFWSDPATSH